MSDALGTRWQSKHCIGCDFRSDMGTCDYLLIMRKRRPCPYGDRCTVKRSVEPAHRKFRQWDVKLAEKMYDAGKTDVEIAKAVGITKAAVGAWRQRTGRKRIVRGNYTAAYEKRRTEHLKTQHVISEKRKALGLTQGQLADLCGVRRGMISGWETGVQPADWDALGKAGISK